MNEILLTCHKMSRKGASLFAFSIVMLYFVAGCTVNSSSSNLSTSSPDTAEPAQASASANPISIAASPTACDLPEIAAPTMPAVVPGYTELDKATGLHMTGIVQDIDLTSYRLEVTGHVDHPLKLSYEELRCMPRVEKNLTLTCPGFFQDQATWAGVPLDYLLNLAGVQSGSLHIKLYGADGYYVTVPLENATGGESFLAYEWEGEPLPKLHGFPVRAVFPGMAGSNWVKWLVEIEVY